MKSVAGELLHQPDHSKEWFELFCFNFSDKKNKVYGSIEMEVLPKRKKVLYSWQIILDGVEHRAAHEDDFDGDYDAVKFACGIMKLTIASPGQKYRLELKGDGIAADLMMTGLFGIYDYPHTPDKEGNPSRHQYESLLWNRLEQRCKVTGSVKFKNADKKLMTRKVDCSGQREKHWGERKFDKVHCFSRYMIQFRDMSFSLTCINFGDIILSSGYMSKKSGNIPVDETELEHIDLAQDGMPAVSEISYKDSQDDRDLIVSNRLYSVKLEPRLFGKKTMYHFRSFSESIIVGAIKKGIGMEEHYLSREYLGRITR